MKEVNYTSFTKKYGWQLKGFVYRYSLTDIRFLQLSPMYLIKDNGVRYEVIRNVPLKNDTLYQPFRKNSLFTRALHEARGLNA